MTSARNQVHQVQTAPPGGSPASADGPEASEHVLSLRGLRKVYPEQVEALVGISLDIQAGEFVTLLGPSGSGKTTLLMLIAGFERPTAGRVFASGRDITDVPPERRSFGMVFQNYALFPHMTIAKNVAYPLNVRGIRGKQADSAVQQALAMAGLEGLGRRRPRQLSGGQQQRVALARALVYRPAVLLLDEPLGSLDRALRERMQTELRRLHRAVGVTFVYVTHDQDEALTMSDRIVVMRNGAIEQVGTPQEVYARPASTFVASFVGRANLLPGTATGSDDGEAAVQLTGGPLVRAACASTVRPGDQVSVVVRPEHMWLRSGPPRTNRRPGPELKGRILDATFAGNVWRYAIETSMSRIEVHSTRRAPVSGGDIVTVGMQAADAWAVPQPTMPQAQAGTPQHGAASVPQIESKSRQSDSGGSE